MVSGPESRGRRRPDMCPVGGRRVELPIRMPFRGLTAWPQHLRLLDHGRQPGSFCRWTERGRSRHLEDCWAHVWTLSLLVGVFPLAAL